jgi:hypothetical protein
MQYYIVDVSIVYEQRDHMKGPIKGTYVPIDQHGLNGWENAASDVLWTYRFRHTLIVAKHTH